MACGMLVHSSSIAVQSCWILAGTGTLCCIRRSRASQTCSIGDMTGEYAGYARTGMFSASRYCVQILATWGRALSHLQVVQNAAARLITGTKKRDHISPILACWLPVKFRIDFKIAVFVFKAVSGLAPKYISDRVVMV